MVNNEKLKIEITIDNLTKPQLLALHQFFKNWIPLCKAGASRKVSYYVDGDGNLHPDISFKLPPTITKDEVELAEECYSEDLDIDFDKIAWRL